VKVDIDGSDRLCLEALLDFGDRPQYISVESEKVSFSALKRESSPRDLSSRGSSGHYCEGRARVSVAMPSLKASSAAGLPSMRQF